MTTCLCGIARVDCEYHRPEPEPAHDDWCDAVSYSMVGISDMHRTGQGVVRLSSDCGEYVRTYRDGKLVDEEPAEAYKDHTIDAMVQSYKGIVMNSDGLKLLKNTEGCPLGVIYYGVRVAT